MGLSSGPTLINLFEYSTEYPLPQPLPPSLPAGGGSGTPGDGTTGGNSNTGGTINSTNPDDPDINASNGDYIYPCDSTFITHPHNQWEAGNNTGGLSWSCEIDNCLAHALTMALEIMEYKKRGVQYQFSYGWIYGNRSNFQNTSIKDNEGLDTADTLNAIRDIGVCMYDTLPKCWLYKKANEPIAFPQVNWSLYPSPNQDEYTQVQNIYNSVINERVHFRIGSWQYVNQSDFTLFKTYIQTYGCGLMWLYNGQDLWNAETNDGIVVYNASNPLDSYSHVMCIRGWKTIAGQNYWICQNSWKNGNTGALLGHNGFFFIPFNYPRIINLIKLVPCFASSTTFNWSTSIVSGGIASLLANDWNNLVDILLSKMHSRALSANPPLQYIPPSTLFTASVFNQVNSNIGQMTSTGIASKSAGNSILASDLNTLVTKINSL
jgi:hypothetical protein